MGIERTLSERFWSLARANVEIGEESTDPVVIIAEVVDILDAIERGVEGGEVDRDAAELLAQLRNKELGSSYAAPERVGDEVLDTRSLVFSVGVLIFERLTGQHPFGADQSRHMARMRRGEFGSGVNYFPQVPPALRTMLMRAMGPFPEERFQSLDELRSSLDAFLAAERRGENAGPTRRAGPGCRADTAEPEPAGIDGEALAEDVDLSGVDEPAPRPDPAQPAGATAAPVAERTAPQLASRAAWLAGGIAIGAVAMYVLAPPRGGEGGRAASSKPAETAPVVSASGARATTTEPETATGTQSDETETGSNTGDEPAKAATKAAAPEPTKAAEPEPAKATAPEPTKAAEPAKATEPEPTKAAEPEPTKAAEFDPHESGRRAAALGRSCLSEARLRRGTLLGVSVQYNRKGVGALYFAGSSNLTWPEKRCFRKAVLGMELSPAPDKAVLVQYRVRFRSDGQEVVAKLIR